MTFSRADQAELDVIVFAFLDGFYDVHRPRCGVCSVPGQPWCEAAHRALDHVVGWMGFRALKTRAEILRRFEEAA